MEPNATTPVLTSDKLTALNAEQAKVWQEMIKFSEPNSKEAKDARLAYWKIENDIKAETLALQKAENDRKIAEARNERIALNQKQLNAYLAFKTAPKNTPNDKLAELETAFNTAKEAVDNELLAKYAHSRPAKTTTSENGQTGSNSDKKAAIIEMYLANKTHAEIEAAGYARSTVWHTIDKYKKANVSA